jgi:hypothetical protein
MVAARAQPRGSERVMDNEAYGSARGTAGLTGASARDFANQAQGLGGLVRLYATYAANVFAVSAAFTALSNAMDTTNMVKGLDQLGAATGRNLGGLSKRLVEITDGAISFKDSMDAVAKTTSAGMASRDVERLAMVAKNASLALGVAMPDAMNRLSRGITKLEPELLDELGIFTKIDPAVQAYSRAVGKAASQLTDFERRQAFANAVLLEGEAKFGELASAAVNPYDTLLASLKNVTQQALEVVNKVLGPMVSLLASSPGALAGALAVLGTVLLRQAIPALTEFKAGLAGAADAATEVAKGKAEDAKAARARIDKDIIAEVENRAAKEIDAVDRAEQKIRDLRKAGYKKDSLAARLLSQDLDDIRKEDLAKQEEIARRLESRATRMAADPAADPKAVQNAQRAAEANREVVTTLTSAKVAQEEFFKTEKRLIEQAETAAKGRSIYGLTIQASLNAQDAATKKSIVSNAAYNASLIGMTGAFRLMNAEIAKAGLTLNFFQLGLLKAKAGIAMLVGVVGTLSAVINGLLGAIGMIAAVIGIFDSVFSKASKEMDAFNSVLTKVDDAAANAARTLAHLDKKGGYATGTIDGISAMANAFVELASSAKEAVDSATVALAKMGTWDKIKDAIFSTFGGGVEKNLAKALTKDVTSALNILTKSGLGEEARETFKAILGIDSLDTESVNNAILKLSDSAKNKLVTALSEANTKLNITASRLQSFKSASESTTKAYQDFILSTANTNPLFRVGSNLENLAKSMESIVTGGAKEMEAAMISLSESPQQGVLFGTKFTSQLVGLRKGFLDQAAAVTAYENRLQDLDKQIEDSSAAMEKMKSGSFERFDALGNLNQLKKDRDVIQKNLDLLPRDKIVAARDLFNKGLDHAFTEGSRLISVGLGQAAEKAAQTIAKANLGGLTGENLAREQLRINQKDIDIQIRAIDTNINLILSQERLRASIDLSNAKAASAQAQQDKRPPEVIQRLKAGELAAEGIVALLGQQGTPNLSGTKEQLAQRAGITDNPDAARILANQALGLNAQIGAQLASRREQQGARTAANVTGQREIVQGSVQDLNRAANLEQAITAQQQTRLGILTSISGISTRESVVRQNMFEIDALTTRQMEEQRNINAAITNAASTEEKLKQEGYKRLILAKQEEELRNLFLQNRQRLLQTEIEQIGRRTELERSGAELQNTLRTTALETQSQELALYSSAYDVSRQVVISQQSALDIQKAQLETNTAIAQAEAVLQQKRDEAEARKKALAADDIAGAAAINAELQRQVDINNNTVASLTAQGAAKVNILQKTREINLEQERYNLLLENSGRLAESLGTVFGDVGSKLGSLTESLTKIAISTEQGAKALEKIGKDADSAWSSGNIDQAIQLEKDYEVQKKKNVKTELDGNIKAISGAKNVFKEKTFAYRALDKVEKAMHIFRMASMIKEVAMDIWKTGKSVANSAIRIGKAVIEAGVDGVKAVVKAIASMPFPLNIAAGAATAAVVAGLLSKIGGSGPSVAGGGFVPNAEQRQETQGTAMGWNDQGQKVQVRRGVFGDTDAKSESIANSLELIRDNSVDGLSYNNRMLKALENIDRGINNTAKGLFNIQGLRTGTMFGTVPGSQSGGGLLGTGFLGSKTTRNITDSGLIIEGTFAQLASDTNKAVIDFFEQVTVSKRSWYGKTRTWVETRRTEIDNATSDFFQDIFSSATEMFVEVGKKAGIGASAINQILGDMDVGKNFASLRGLKGEEFQQELSAIIGTVLDDAALAIFTEFEKFSKFGEGMLETVVRVVDTNEKVRQQIKNTVGQDIEATLAEVGVTIAKTSSGFFRMFRRTTLTQSFDPAEIKKISYQITESLVELSGGLENFLKQSNFFRENFLTESERLAPVQNAVTEEMNRLGFASVDTREEFKELVRSLDLTTEAGQENYQALMNVAEGFDKVASAAEEFAQKAKSMQMRILELTGTPEQLLAAQRKDTLEETDPRLRATQQYIFALEDVKSAEDALTKARQDEANKIKQQQQATQGLVNNIQRYIESLRKFKESLLLGAASPLTPQQRYTESKRQFDAIFATATGTAATPAEQSAKDAALGQLEGAASAFLDASKVYNASSAQYSTDFNYIQEALTKSISTLDQQLTNEEKTLQALNSQIGALETLNTSTLSVAEAVNRLAAAQSAANALKPQANTEIKSAVSGSNVSTEDLISAAKSSGVGFTYGGTVYGAQGSTISVAASKESISEYINKTQSGVAGYTAQNLFNIFKEWGLSSKTVAEYMGISQDQILGWFKMQDATIPAFAAGTNFVPEDMLAQIHRGERIIPAADNAQLMQNLNSRDEANRVLVTEIRNLRQEVKQLREQQAKETGSIIVANFDAQQRAAEQIEAAVANTAQQSNWTAKVRESVKLK